jgi:hypothetical protein
VEAAGLLPVGGVDPSRSRVRFPAATSRNKVLSLSSPSWWCSAPVPSTRAWRWDSLRGSLVQESVAGDSSGGEFSGLCSEDGEATSGCAEGRRVELQARLFYGGVCRRWRVCIQGHRGLRCVPGRWIFSACFISSKMASVYCGSSQSLLAMKLWSTAVGFR